MKERGLIIHAGHCIDTIRQAILCFSDISTIYWEWIPSVQETYANARTTHTCRDFDSIKEWAMEHTMKVNFDYKAHLEGAPEYLYMSESDRPYGSNPSIKA